LVKFACFGNAVTNQIYIKLTRPEAWCKGTSSMHFPGFSWLVCAICALQTVQETSSML